MEIHLNNKKIITSVVAAAVLIAAVIGGWAYYTATPRYALSQAGKAIQHHDWEKFQTYVDVNALSAALATDMGTMAGQALGTGQKSAKLAKLIGTLLAAKLTPVLRQDLECWVKNDYPPERKSLLKTLLPPSGGGKVKLEQLDVSGDKGRARLSLGADASLEVEIDKVGDEWKVTRILNMPELFKAARKHQAATPLSPSQTAPLSSGTAPAK
ncbi:MAG: hypothetical protein BWY87_00875 [Deltaproteobacteria bacterium ADurb.Bin510]|nr:MAG: hypothetical protein BWY87_00875 [Deltaproteobacteria bacterium ADurb.Bin510]